jgi:hypothetical protein
MTWTIPDHVQIRIVAAAVRNVTGQLVVSARHYDSLMHAQIAARMDAESFHGVHGDNEGFIDQYGRYLTRREAYLVARAAGQILNEAACATMFGHRELYSEALY